MSVKSSTIAIGATALALAAGAYFYASSSSSSSSDEPISEEDLMSAEECAKLFSIMIQKMKLQLNKLGQMIQQIQASGQQIPQEQLQAWLLSEYEKGVMSTQKEVVEAEDVDEDDWQTSTLYHLKNNSSETLSAVVKEFKLMYRQIGGSPPAEGNLPNWSIDEFIGVLEVYMRSMTTCMTQIVSTVRKESGNVDGKLEDKQLVEIRGAFQASADKFSNKVLQEGYGIDQDVFASVMQKFQTEKRVNDCLTALAEEQNRAFKEMGVA